MQTSRIQSLSKARHTKAKDLPGVVDIIRDLRQAYAYCFHALGCIPRLSEVQPTEKSHILIIHRYYGFLRLLIPCFEELHIRVYIPDYILVVV